MPETRTVPIPILDEPHERLEWARERAGFDDATAAARYFAWNINTYRSHENGTRGLRKGTAVKYALAFKVPYLWLLHGEGAMTAPVDPEIVSLWGNLSEDDQQAVKQLMQRLARKAA